VTAEKVEIVKANASTYGLNVTLDAIGLPKSTWYYWKSKKVDYKKKYSHLHQPLIKTLNDNPAYGYRRVTPEIVSRGFPVGETVVRRVLGMWNLSLRRCISKPKPSVPRKILAREGHGMNLVSGIEQPAPLQVVYTDFTEILYADGRKKAYLMPLLDHATKWAVGWALGYRANTALALEALSKTVATLDDVGLSLEGCIIHHDQDAVYTGFRWLRAVLIKHCARISYSENGAKGNTAMESFNGRFKTENGDLLYGAANIWELKRLVAQQMTYYNNRRRHSTLENTAPIDYIIQEEILPQLTLGLATQCT